MLIVRISQIITQEKDKCYFSTEADTKIPCNKNCPKSVVLALEIGYFTACESCCESGGWTQDFVKLENILDISKTLLFYSAL